MPDWYESWIEPGIREQVRLLRNGGVNTRSSCEHSMSIEAELIGYGELDDVRRLLFGAGYRSFTVKAVVTVCEGKLVRRVLGVSFPLPGEDQTDFSMRAM